MTFSTCYQDIKIIDGPWEQNNAIVCVSATESMSETTSTTVLYYCTGTLVGTLVDSTNYQPVILLCCPMKNLKYHK